MNGDRALRQNYEQVLKRIRDACEAAGRPADSVRLLAVSKAFPAANVLALAALGQRAFGENYLQEALDKIAACSDERSAAAAGRSAAIDPARASPDTAPRRAAPGSPLEWHFIGPIQSNKTRPIAEHFDWVHSVDREKIARRLAEQRPADLPPLNLCLQVNVSGEASKSGVAPGEVVALALACEALPGVRLRGLMAIPEPTEDVALQRARFATLRELHARVREALAGNAANGIFANAASDFDTLSMGMSADLESAVMEGATIVRVGSALFGARPPRQQAVSPST
jgi:pyridoxal phosphate enzyme (YggS family)